MVSELSAARRVICITTGMVLTRVQGLGNVRVGRIGFLDSPRNEWLLLGRPQGRPFF